MSKYRCDRSLFQLIDKNKFDVLAKKWNIDKGVRNFSTWEMTQALVSCFVMRLGSYREVEAALKIPDSTFGDALRRRSSGFFQELCDLILVEIKNTTRVRKTKRAIRRILALDSTEIRVHGSLTADKNWQKQKSDRKASVKFHVVWDVEGHWIEDFRMSGVRRHDLIAAKTLSLCERKIYVFDRAYVDLKFWLDIVAAGSDFVTRLKQAPRKKALHKSVLKPEDLQKSGVLWEGTWTPSEAACYRYKVPLKKLKFRHIIYRDSESGRVFDFITSNWTGTAQEIANIYKMRWSVELLFKWLKSHLDIRYLATKMKNAIHTQLAIVVLVQLLLQLKRIKEKITATSWEVLREIRTRSISMALSEYGVPDGCRWKTLPTADHPL